MRVIRTRRGAIFRLMSHFRHRPSYLTTNLHTGTFLKSFPDQLHGAQTEQSSYEGALSFPCLVPFLVCSFVCPYSSFFWSFSFLFARNTKVATASCFTRQAYAYLNNEPQGGESVMNFGDAMMMGVASIDAALLMGQDTLSRRSLCLSVGGNGCFMMKILVTLSFLCSLILVVLERFFGTLVTPVRRRRASLT
jgi:hypothetical protein